MPLGEDISDLITKYVTLSEQADIEFQKAPYEDAKLMSLCKEIDKQESVVRQKVYILDNVLDKILKLRDKDEYLKQSNIFFATRESAQKEIETYEKMVGDFVAYIKQMPKVEYEYV